MHSNSDIGTPLGKAKAKDARLSKLERELQATESKKKHHEDALFNEAYPLIEQSLARNVPQKTIIEKFNAIYGLRLHPARFRQMLGDERSRRNHTGDVALCKSCGHALTPIADTESTMHSDANNALKEAA